MTDIEAGIERAAREIRPREHGSFVYDDDRRKTRAALTAAFPGLMSGKEWLAPMEADSEMCECGPLIEETTDGRCPAITTSQADAVFEAMRDAYLTRKPSV